MQELDPDEGILKMRVQKISREPVCRIRQILHSHFQSLLNLAFKEPQKFAFEGEICIPIDYF